MQKPTSVHLLGEKAFAPWPLAHLDISPFPLWGSISELSEILPPGLQLVDKRKYVMLSVRTATPKGGPVSLEGTQERNKDWPRVEVHIKGVIPVSPDFQSPHRNWFSVNLVIYKSFVPTTFPLLQKLTNPSFPTASPPQNGFSGLPEMLSPGLKSKFHPK